VDWVAVCIDGARRQVDPQPSWAKVILEDSTSWARQQGVDRIPTTLVVDEKNLVRWVGWGISQENDLVEAVKRAVAGPPSGGPLYLTFDDFPLGRSGALLDVLRQLRVPATFFVVGEKAAREPELLTRAGKEGHALAVHGWTHSTSSPEASRARAWIGKKTGQAPRWLRTPGSTAVRSFDGSVWPGRMVDPSDFLRPGEGEIRRRVLSRLAPGAVIQLHAGVEQTIAVLPDLVSRARRLGFTFEALP
jgi:peptidoglycan/xylan/chitin deacetylase (PgdA/CDA1 family)